MTKNMAESNRRLCWYISILLVLPFAEGVWSMHTPINIQESLCGLTSGVYHTDTLLKPISWMLNYTQTSANCIGGEGSGVKGCNFTLAFCRPVNCSDTDKELMNATACITTAASDKQVTFKLGSYNSSKNPFMKDPNGEGLSFLVQYTNGSNYTTSDNRPCNLSMEMQFNCNETSLWAADQGGKQSNISNTTLNSLSFNDKTCKYTLSFNYSGACPTLTPYPNEPQPYPLSFGSVLLIIFFVLFSVYCVFGSMCKFAAGSRGKDALPHSDFWVELPAYIADGFMFTCRCCSTGSSASRSYDSI